MSAGLAAAKAAAKQAGDAPEPATPFYHGLKAILGRSGAHSDYLHKLQQRAGMGKAQNRRTRSPPPA